MQVLFTIIVLSDFQSPIHQNSPNLSTKNNEYAHHRLILISVFSSDLRSCSLYFVMYEHTAYVIELDYPSKNPYDSAWVIYLWNPSARQSRRLPSPGINLQFACQVKFGFGYNESIDDYIVVGIFGVFDDWGSYDTEVKVYSTRRDSWKRIQVCSV
ncbi:hypothetical protein LguiB_013658 [Lonicera macranthoides]